MSQRHTDLAVLDAARACVADVGIRRTTVSDVARRAGASRMTVYRLFPDADTLWSTLVTREVTEIASQVQREAAHLPTARGRLVAAAIAAVRRLQDDPLVQGILEREPELLLPYIVERHGQSQLLMLEAIGSALDAGQADGSIRQVDRAAACHLLELVIRSAIISGPMAKQAETSDTVITELRHMLDAYLAPR